MPFVGSAQTECFLSLAIPRVKAMRRGGRPRKVARDLVCRKIFNSSHLRRELTTSLITFYITSSVSSVHSEHLRTVPSLREGNEKRESGKENQPGHAIPAVSMVTRERMLFQDCRLKAQEERAEAPLGNAVP